MLGRDVFNGLADALFPRDCMVSGVAVDEHAPTRYLSARGYRELHRVQPPCCTSCGSPFYGSMQVSRRCPRCLELEPVFQEGRTLLLARDAGRVLIHTLKYGKGTYVLDDVALILQDTPGFCEFLANSILVPVPLYPKRERLRTYNQSFLLAKCFADAAPGCVVLDALARVRDTPSQTKLSRKARIDNVKNAFALKPGISLNCNNRYIMIDDVFTTGATLDACARVLYGAGVSRIDVATLAHG